MPNIAKFTTAVFALVLLSLTSTQAIADWNCVCGTTVHVNYPTTCPVCSRSLPNQPSPTPPPYTPPYTPPGAPDSSGVTLGVKIYNAGPRVMVQSVMPNTPAQGLLFPNDQLVKGAFRDAQSGQVQRVQIYSPSDVTRLKTLAGAGQRVALQVFRPTTGTRNFFVNFAAPGGAPVTRTYQVQVNGHTETRTRSVSQSAAAATITEDSTGEAAALLGGGGPGGNAPILDHQGPNQPPSQGGVLPPSQGGIGESAADLLNGN
ncbi:hypothetical protein CA13_67610 [Planctomycetes bacterium CA13]|uniref:Uncharacterized protein n=1 Tax=Novipirellula herctigrandis TaxID=2527986 RepID=A0A5C5YN43_9BACT|nr:hypothetical protein CA13_67610 [Planctomycetes bacterium CA13]